MIWFQGSKECVHNDFYSYTELGQQTHTYQKFTQKSPQNSMTTYNILKPVLVDCCDIRWMERLQLLKLIH